VAAVLIGVVGLFVGVVVAIVAEVVPDRSGGGHSVRTCGSCGEAISPKSLILIRSEASICRSCGTRAPASRLPIVLTTAVAFAIVASIVGNRWQLIPILLLTASLIALSAVDIARYRLPDRLVFPSLGVSLVVLGALSIANDAGDHVVRAVLTGLAYAGMLFVFNMIYPAGLAFGDVKLALLLGLFLGWSATNGIDAARLVVWALLIGMVLGIFSGLFVGLGRRAFGSGFLPDPDFPPAEDGTLEPLMKTAFPFGPALALSTLALVVTSDVVLSAGSILA